MGITVGNAVGGATLTSFNNNGDTVVVFEGHFTGNPTPPSSVTYGGVAMTMLYSVADAATSSFETSAWILTNKQGAPTGVNAVVVTQNDFSASQIFVGATAFSGVNQISPARTASTANSGSTTAATVTPIQAVNDLVVGSVYTFSSSVSAGSGVTQYATHTTATITGASGGIAGSGSGAALSWALTGTVSGDNWVIGAAALIPAYSARAPLYNPYQTKSPLAGAYDVYPNLANTTLKPAVLLAPLLTVNKAWPDSPEINYGGEPTAFMQITTLALPVPVSSNVIRPPLFGKLQQIAPISAPDVYPNLLGTLFAPHPQRTTVQLSTSAPVVAQPVQVDRYPDLLGTTLKTPGTPKFRQLSDSAPRDSRLTQVDIYPNLLATTGKPSTTVVRSQLLLVPQQKRDLTTPDVFPNLLSTTLKIPGTPKFIELYASAPQVWIPPQVDVFPNILNALVKPYQPYRSRVQSDSAPYRAPPPGIDVFPNLLSTTLKVPGTPKFLRLDASAPQVWIPPQVDRYPNVSVTTLVPVPLPLSASTWDVSAPIQAAPPRVDAYPNLLTSVLRPLPMPLSSVRWDASAPSKQPSLGIDRFPNVSSLLPSLPSATTRRLDVSAPRILQTNALDTYPNLHGTTLVPPGTPPSALREFASIPARINLLQVDGYLNLLVTTLQPIPTPTPNPTLPGGRYLSGPVLYVSLQTSHMASILFKPVMYCSLSHAGYVA